MIRHVCHAKDEVPRVSRVQIVVRDCKNAVSVFDFKIFEGSHYVPCVELEPLIVLARLHLVVLQEVVRNLNLLFLHACAIGLVE